MIYVDESTHINYIYVISFQGYVTCTYHHKRESLTKLR